MPLPATHPAPVIHLRRKQDPLNPDLLRIVLVDDEELFVQVFEQMIRAKYEVAVKSFTSSQAAWEELERTAPDMLIVGGVMPDLCGEDIVRRLMARDATYPILVVSGYLSAEYVLGWFPGAPNISFLRKPFSAEQLQTEIEKHFVPGPSPRQRG